MEEGAGSHLVLLRLVLGKALPGQAPAVAAAGRAVGPGEVLGLADEQTPGGGDGAPERRAGAAEVRAVLRLLPEGQLTLAVGVVHRARQGLGQGLGLLGLVQQTVTWGGSGLEG